MNDCEKKVGHIACPEVKDDIRVVCNWDHGDDGILHYKGIHNSLWSFSENF